MGISEDDYPTRDNCPSDEAVSTFARTKNPRDGPRGYPKLLVDIARGGPAGPWNAACVGIVYDEMKQLGWSSMPPWSDVEEAFKVYLRTLRSKYRRNQNGTGPDREESNTLLRMRKVRFIYVISRCTEAGLTRYTSGEPKVGNFTCISRACSGIINDGRIRRFLRSARTVPNFHPVQDSPIRSRPTMCSLFVRHGGAIPL